VELIDVSGEQIIQWHNRKSREEFGENMTSLPVTSLIPADAWSKLYPNILARGKIEKARIEIGSRTFELSASYMKMQREGIIQAILIDITSEISMSTRDFLTGAYNRRKFDEVLMVEMERAKRYTYLLSLAMLDIDHFKTVNDTHGHQAGDALLRELTALIMQHIRTVDHLSRYGGEEFVILAPGTDLEGIARLAEKLRRVIESHSFAAGLQTRVSFGVSQFAPNDSSDTFIERTDKALYRAKAPGRNRVERAEITADQEGL